MSPECSRHQVLRFSKMLVVWWTNKKYSVLINVPQSAQWINSERIYPQPRVSSFPGLISVARVIYNNNKNLVFSKKNCIRPFNKEIFQQLANNLSEWTLFAVWKIRQFFSQNEHRDRFDPPFPCSFSFAF